MMVLLQFAVSSLETLRERSLQFAVMKRLSCKGFGLMSSSPNFESGYDTKFVIFLWRCEREHN